MGRFWRRVGRKKPKNSKKLRRKARKLVSAIAEKKRILTNYSVGVRGPTALSPNTANWDWNYLISAMAKGPGNGQRIGQRIQITKIRLMGDVVASDYAVSPIGNLVVVRLCWAYDKFKNPLDADVLEKFYPNVFNMMPATFDVVGLDAYDVVCVKEWKFDLQEKNFVGVDPGVGTPTTYTYQGKPRRFYWTMYPESGLGQTTFDESDASDPETGIPFIMYMSDSLAAPNPTMRWSSQIEYIDV